MKTQIKYSAIATLSIALFSAGINRAQTPDTVKVKEINTVRDSTTVRDVIIKRDTITKHDTVRVQVPAEVVEQPKDKTPTFRKGEFGIRFLPTFSSLALRTYNGEVIQGQATMSFGYGVMLGLNLGKNVGLQTEVNYNQISQKYKDQNLERQVHINYLNIPVLLTLNTDKSRMVNFNVAAGPQFGINVGSRTSSSGSRDEDTLRAVVAVKQSDIGFAYGAGLDFMLSEARNIRFDIGFRGFYGLVDMDSSNSGSTYNVLVRASRKTYGGYAGITFLF